MTFFWRKQTSHTKKAYTLSLCDGCDAESVSRQSAPTVVSQGLSKKPVASVASSLYLEAAFENQLRKVEALPPTKEYWSEYLRLNALRRRRENLGFGAWWPLVFACSVLIVFATWAQRQSAKDFTFAAPADKFQVLRRFDAYHYQFRWIHAGTATELAVHFCPNYEPQFSVGQTLVWLHYADMGRCWDILPEGYGYKLERKANGLPTTFVDDNLSEIQWKARF